MKTIALRGRYTLAEVRPLWREVTRAAARAEHGDTLYLDLSAVECVDGAATAALDHLRRMLAGRSVRLEFVNPSAEVGALLRVFADAGDSFQRPTRATTGVLTRTGETVVALADETAKWLAFAARVLRSLPDAARVPRSVSWADVPDLMERAGADAVPIVMLIGFLVGVVTAYEAAIQLKRFGATLYVADLVGISVVHELGPLITAVVVAGRSGAAFSAELGTMAVSEEVDALRAIGIDPIRFLVLPRVLALVCVVPLLTLLGDSMGLMGGLLPAGRIGIAAPEYLTETKTIVFASDVFWGLLKSVAFSIAIGLVACQQGLCASGGASSVGRRTTSAVVSSLLAIIVIDALFAPFLRGHRT